MKEVNVSKCMTTNEMVDIVSKLSSIDTALDIINDCKNKSVIKVEIVNDNLRLKK
jgi:hypothetical protein